MSTDELEQIVAKAWKLRELRRARERVRQLERQLRGEPTKPEEPSYIPKFLTPPASRGVRETPGEPRALPLRDVTMSGPSRHFVHLLLLCTLAALPGCASLPSEAPMTTPDLIVSQEVSFGVRTQAADGQFEVLPSSLIARRLQAQLGDRPLSILALSAGGAGGAFGAGAASRLPTPMPMLIDA
jgi:hypothetical protein